MEQIGGFRSDVRIGHVLSEAERQHVANRKELVKKCLQKHHIHCSVEDVPNIAVLGSGGGERAMIGLLGALSQLGQEGLLDCIMYLSGVSGSTWCMASLYKEEDWSTKMETVTHGIIKRLDEGKVTLKEQMQKLVKYSKKDNFSLTDIWAAVVVSKILKEIDENTLTQQRGQHTKDPYPIHNVIDKKCMHEQKCRPEQKKDVWFEITPDESGYSLTGAYVDTACFGSQFNNGTLIKKQPEMDMLYLQGMCGSALADMKEIILYILETLFEWLKDLLSDMQTQSSRDTDQEQVCRVVVELLELNLHILRNENPANSLEALRCLLREPSLEKCEHEAKMLSRNLRHWTGEKESEEEVKKFTLHVCEHLLSFDWSEWWDIVHAIITSIKVAVTWKWGTTYNYLYNMSVPEVDSSILTAKTRDYMDAGLFLNSPYFSVLRKERDIDLIISLDFGSDSYETVDKTAKMCKDLQELPHLQDLRFPDVDYYMFKRNDGKAPRVIQIPLFNAVNCNGQVKKWEERYSTFQLPYSPEMIKDLLEKSASNITHNKDNLLKDIREVIAEKKKKKHQA